MIHSLKTLCMAIIAVLAVGAVASSTSLGQTQGELTSDGPFKLTGTDTAGAPTVIQYNGTQKLTCHAHYEAGKENQTVESPPGSGRFTHSVASESLTSITATPAYTSCTGEIGELKAPATATMNGCDFVWRIGTTTETLGQYEATADLLCPAGKEVEVHIYSNPTHEVSICTYKLAPQANKGGLAVQNEGGGKITLGGTALGIKGSRTGILCGGANTTETATLKVHALLEGRNAGAKRQRFRWRRSRWQITRAVLGYCPNNEIP